jgi:hypothetical protein
LFDSIWSFLQISQKKTEKEKRKEKEKRVKGCGDTIWPKTRTGPRPSKPSSQNGIPFSLFSSLTGGARLSAPTPSSFPG